MKKLNLKVVFSRARNKKSDNETDSLLYGLHSRKLTKHFIPMGGFAPSTLVSQTLDAV